MNLRRYILLLLFIISLSSCKGNPVYFNEAQWRRDVEKQSIEKLYAPHFKDGTYFNPWMPIERGGSWEFLKWRLSRKARYTDEERTFKATVVSHLSHRIRALPDVDFISWVGHGTFLIPIRGQYWLTDPIFSKRAFIPKRVTPPAINADELKELTDSVNVIISHNHYDHLDVKSIRSLPDKSRIFVPRGLKEYVASIHQYDVRELDWWESVDFKADVKLVCLPAQHWSRRIGQGVNSTLWASYVLITALLFALGIWVCAYTANKLGVHDHPSIVIDEIVGFLITMAAVPAGWLWIVIGFVLFRLFDALKPWPISWFDRVVTGGFGIMLDDVIAGLFSLAILHGLNYFQIL